MGVRVEGREAWPTGNQVKSEVRPVASVLYESSPNRKTSVTDLRSWIGSRHSLSTHIESAPDDHWSVYMPNASTQILCQAGALAPLRVARVRGGTPAESPTPSSAQRSGQIQPLRCQRPNSAADYRSLSVRRSGRKPCAASLRHRRRRARCPSKRNDATWGVWSKRSIHDKTDEICFLGYMRS